jgi:hypothetical protein
MVDVHLRLVMHCRPLRHSELPTYTTRLLALLPHRHNPAQGRRPQAWTTSHSTARRRGHGSHRCHGWRHRGIDAAASALDPDIDAIPELLAPSCMPEPLDRARLARQAWGKAELHLMAALLQVPWLAVRVDWVVLVVMLGISLAAIRITTALGDTSAAEEVCIEAPSCIFTAANAGVQLAVAEAELVVATVLRIVHDRELDWSTRLICGNCRSLGPIRDPIIGQVGLRPISTKITAHTLGEIAATGVPTSVMRSLEVHCRAWHIEAMRNVRRCQPIARSRPIDIRVARNGGYNHQQDQREN